MLVIKCYAAQLYKQKHEDEIKRRCKFREHESEFASVI